MPGIRFPQFLRDYGLKVLPVATTDVAPGAVLAKKKRGFLYQGHLSEILSKPAGFWKPELNQANIIDGTLERRFSLKGRASLDAMGVRIDGGLGRARSVTFSITRVQARTFRNGRGHASMFSLKPLLAALRRRAPRTWKLVKNRWIVLETYYASEATVTFATSGSVDLRADIDEAGSVSVEGGGGITWKGNRTFRITNNTAVPFAFRGFKA